MQALILLGINAGLGNSDVARLHVGHLDLCKGVLDYPRPKTGEERRVPLWKETVKALKLVIESRPEALDPKHNDLVW